MKLLRIKASNFKNCIDDFTIDFIPKSRKTAEDKEYELQEIADGLYVYSTGAFIGKNASGKTSAIELMDCCYSILSDFRVENKHYSFENVKLEIVFYHDGNVYKYKTVLMQDKSLQNKALFTEQKIWVKEYLKSYVNKIYDDDTYTEFELNGELPEDTSAVFFVLKKRKTQAIYFGCDGEGFDSYQLSFKALNNYGISSDVVENIIRIFDENISKIEMLDEHNYKLTYSDKTEIKSDKELFYFLSSGTTKGMLLYIMAFASLKNGFDLIIDEVENHFHKTLVENMISLYKDKSVNQKNASLYFTTHYSEILDLFNRQDNIWICKADKKVCLENMYGTYNVRPELLKSKQFYNNVFDTAVNYSELMGLKRKLKK